MKTQKPENPEFSTLIQNLVDLIEKGNAHVSLNDALSNIRFTLLGKKPKGLPYSIWQIAEHIRIAQWDILEFSRNAKHVSLQWPDDYWPKDAAPKSEESWKKCIEQIHADRKLFVEMIKNAGDNLYESFKYGTGQSLLKEALVLADHNSYHTGEIIIIRRLLNAWEK
jgi:hypothetical protein